MDVHLEKMFPEMNLLCLIIVSGPFYQFPGVKDFSSGAILFGATLAYLLCPPVSANKVLQLPQAS